MRPFALLLPFVLALPLPGQAAPERRALGRDHALALAHLQPAIDRAIDRGVAWLLDHQQRDGSWTYAEDDFAGGQTALCVYALLKSGVRSDHAAVQRALLHLRQQTPTMVYAIACRLLALRTAGRAEDRSTIEPLAKELLRLQNGSWSYPNDDGAISRLHHDRDLSITQFALFGLRAAREAGVAIPPRVWADAADAVLRYQETPVDVPAADPHDGTHQVAGFRYQWSTPSPPTGSMTAAGTASLALCRAMLGDAFTGRRAAQVERAIQLGRAWLVQHWSVTANPGKADWLYYYLYGLERVGSMLGTEYLGEQPWYLEGARQLVKAQAGDGHWHRNGDEPDTCFALLFLSRATAPVTGGHAVASHTIVAEDGEVGLRVMGASDGTPLRAWITHIGRTKPGEKPPAVRVAAVEYRLDGEPLAMVEGDRDQPRRQGEAYPMQHAFERRGKHRLQALVTVVDSDGERELHSDVVDVVVDHVLEPWMLPAAEAAAHDVLGSVPVDVVASSQDDGSPPERAVDGKQSTAWCCKADDDAPAITVRLRRPVRAAQVVLSQAASRRAELGQLDRITRVELLINGRSAGEKVLATDELEPTAIALPNHTTLRELTVRIVARERGSTGAGRCGFAEIALEQR